MKPLLEYLREDGIELRKKGPRWLALCPFHKEKTASFTVEPEKGDGGLYKCFGCGAGGDSVTYLERARKLTKKEALRLHKGPPSGERTSSGSSDRQQEHKAKTPPKQPPFVTSLPRDAVDISDYEDADGKLKFKIVRRPPDDDGKKRIRPYTPARKGNKKGWVIKNLMESDRPLFRLPQLLASDPKQQVMLVEGEKCAKAIVCAFPKAVVTTWSHGTNSWRRTDFSPLYGRDVLCVSDADESGRKAMTDIADLLVENRTNIRVVLPLGDTGDDIADEIEKGGAKRAAEWLKTLAEDYASRAEEAPATETGPEPEKKEPKKEKKEPVELPPVPSDIRENPYFEILGNSDDQVVVKLVTEQVLRIGRSSMTLARHLLSIAPDISWWLATLHADSFSSPVAQHAGTGLIRIADNLGQVDMNRITGRGARLTDLGTIVWHLGDRLLVDDREMPIQQYKNPDDRNIYISGPGVVAGTDEDLLDQDTRAHVAETLMRYRWKTPMDGKIMLGWLVTAIVGGALEWRPHVWFLGKTDHGKSWFIKHIIMRVQDSISVHLADPTAASIARRLRSDSLPLIVDEAEPEQSWLEDVVTLARVAAGGDGERTRADGTGGYTSFAPQFSAVMSSTKLPRLSDADNNRFALVELAQQGVADWPQLEQDILELFQPPSRIPMQIRTTIIRHTAHIAQESLRLARAKFDGGGTGSRRARIEGALSAGWQWWTGTDEMVEIRHLNQENAHAADAAEVLHDILSIRLREHGGGDTNILTILATQVKNEHAGEHGVMKRAEGLYIAPTNSAVKRALSMGRYSHVNLRHLLEQIPGVRFTKNGRNFSPGYKTRAIVVPYEVCHQLGIDITFDAQIGGKDDDDNDPLL